MKVVHVSNADIKWGASRAGYGIFKALDEIGVDVTMLVQRKYSDNKKVYSLTNSVFDKIYSDIRTISDLMLSRSFSNTKLGKFSLGNIGVDISKHTKVIESDIIHLHFINEGMLSLKNIEKLIKLNKPIFWTLHDMWAFTGGCHYSNKCLKYLNHCHYCPFLKTPSDKDYSYKNFKRKDNIFSKLNLFVVSPSKWLKDCASQSRLFQKLEINIIPYAINYELYQPLDKKQCRIELTLPKNKILLLFGAMTAKEERKGYKYLVESLIKLNKNHPHLINQIELLIVGRTNHELFENIPYKISFLGRINDDEKMVKIYNSTDFFIAPSLEDNYPNTVMESLACGIPVIAFNVGGIPDMITHQENGYLAELKNDDSLMEGIFWAINLNEKTSEIKKNARNQILKNNKPNLVAEQYLLLYKSALGIH